VLVVFATSRQVKQRINLGGDNGEIGTDHTYIGTHLTNKNKDLVETQAQIQAADKDYYTTLLLIKICDINWRV
jgi:hypothetical protein